MWLFTDFLKINLLYASKAQLMPELAGRAGSNGGRRRAPRFDLAGRAGPPGM
jgi:hypothetical protein